MAAEQQVRPREILYAAIPGTLVTFVGLVLLYLAGRKGAVFADYSLELGAAVGLAGALWWCSSRIREEPLQGRVDYSALLIVGTLGTLGVVLAVRHGKPAHEVMLTTGAAMATLWLFFALERQFVLEDDLESPLWVKVLMAPAYPFVWWLFRGWDDAFRPDPPVPLDPSSLMIEIELSAQLGALDRTFEPTPDEVAVDLGVRLPVELIELVSHEGARLRGQDGTTVILWSWAAIKLHPIDTSKELVFFANEVTAEPEGGGTAWPLHLAVDLREGPMHGAVVRCSSLGWPNLWRITGAVETVAVSLTAWRKFCVMTAEGH
jgi:hypothetical protein